MSKNRPPHLKAALALATALTVIFGLALLSASVASAGSWIEVSCVNPTQSIAPSEGWSSFEAGAGYGSNNETSCGVGRPMYASLSTSAPAGVGANETLQYTPPTGSTLAGGSLDVDMFADGFGTSASGTAVAYSPTFVYDGSDVFFQCAAGITSCGGSTNDFSGVLSIPAGRGGSLYLSAGCGGSTGLACDEGGSEGAWSLVRVWWANLLLTNNSTPIASGFNGPLLAPNASGVQDLAFTAGDPDGPGVFQVTVDVDGKAAYSGTPENNDGRCASVGTTAGALMFDYSQPCRTSESVDLPIDTTTLKDGQHTLKVTVEDAAKNTSTVYDGTITTHNTTVNTTLGAQPGPGTHATSAAGSPNGAGASEQAQLTLGVPKTITRSYKHRALRITGRLLDSNGHPITGATVNILAQPGGSPAGEPLETVKTGSNGTFAAPVPAGPSRTIEVAYRAFSGDPGYAARAKVQELVKASVKLSVDTHRTSANGTIVLSGKVISPVPAQGVVVEMLVHYRGSWVPFRYKRTDSRGRFEVVYEFEGGVGHFPFRALILAGQVGFPFARSSSAPVDVATS